MALPYYRAFKQQSDGEYVWLTPSERFKSWVADCLWGFGIIFTRAADRLRHSVTRP